MKIIFLITGAYLILGFFGIVALRENKRKKEMKIYILFMTLSLGLSIFLSSGIKYNSIASLVKGLLSIFINV